MPFFHFTTRVLFVIQFLAYQYFLMSASKFISAFFVLLFYINTYKIFISYENSPNMERMSVVWKDLGEMLFVFLFFFCFIWKKKQTNLLNTVKLCSKIIDLPVQALPAQCNQQTIKSAHGISRDPEHILLTVFQWLPSGHRPVFPNPGPQGTLPSMF